MNIYEILEENRKLKERIKLIEEYFYEREEKKKHGIKYYIKMGRDRFNKIFNNRNSNIRFNELYKKFSNKEINNE